MAMEVLNETVSEEYLREFEEKYNEEKKIGEVTVDTTFQYSWCLIRSRLNSDIGKGIHLLEELLKKSARDKNQNLRDYLYYLAVGYARLKDYAPAMKHVKALLQLEPGNRQAQDLEKAIQKNMESDALKGAAIAGGAVLAAGALVGLGMAFFKSK